MQPALGVDSNLDLDRMVGEAMIFSPNHAASHTECMRDLRLLSDDNRINSHHHQGRQFLLTNCAQICAMATLAGLFDF